MAKDSCDFNKNEEVVTAKKTLSSDSSSFKTYENDNKEQHNNCIIKVLSTLPTASELRQYTAVLICGLTIELGTHLDLTSFVVEVNNQDILCDNIELGSHFTFMFLMGYHYFLFRNYIISVSIWGSLWFMFKDLVVPGGYIFNLSAVSISGYILGHTLERYTTICPMVGMTFAGVLFRNLAPWNHLEDPITNSIDFHLRRIYPVIILTRGPLSWNWEYIKNNSVKVFSLATVPWIVECLTVAVLTHMLLGFPWYWGVHLGAILASVSPAVVVPTCVALNARGLGVKNQIALLVGNAGGLDTAFTEGMFGVINSAIFFPSPPTYRIVKAFLAIFVGILVGILWGLLADLVPDHNDFYAPTIRSLLLFSGGLLVSYVAAYFGWGGTGGVAIMVCAATASTRWSRRGWPINNYPVSEVYKLLWRIFEPMLFSLSGYYLEVSQVSLQDFGLIVACIFAALILRLLTAFLVAIGNELSVKESLFVAVTWIPKAIVEAVLVRVATDSLWSDGSTSQDVWIAKQHSNIIVIAILLTTTLGSVLTTALGPILLSNESRVAPKEFYRKQSFSTPQPVEIQRHSKTRVSFQFIDA